MSHIPAAAPPPKGLPGFLRRSLRNPYDGAPPSPATRASPSPQSSSSKKKAVKVEGLPIPPLPAVEEKEQVVAGSKGGTEAVVEEGVDSSAANGPHSTQGQGPLSSNTATAAAEASPTPSTAEESSKEPKRRGRIQRRLFASRKNDTAHSDTEPRSRSVSPVPPSPNTTPNGTTKEATPTSHPHPDLPTESTTTSQQQQEEKTYKEITFEKTIFTNVVNLRDLRRLGWNGIPPQYRADSWKILLGYLPANASRRAATLQRKRADYADAIRQHYLMDDQLRTLQEQETLRQVLVDVPRTAPDVGLFRHARVRRCLERLLYIWAMRHPASSYVQGINDLATPFFAVFLSGYFGGRDVFDGKIMDQKKQPCHNQQEENQGEEGGPPPSSLDFHSSDSNIVDTHASTEHNNDNDNDHEDQDENATPGAHNNHEDYLVTDAILSQVEADCYWCLTKLLAGIQDHYTCDQPGVQRMVARLEELARRIDADLCLHLRNTGIEFMQFAFKWMNCLLLREFSLRCVVRLWDTYLSEGDGGFEDFHVYVCAAFLCQFSGDVRGMEFDELFGFMQNMPTEHWGEKEVEVLLSQAYVLSTLFGGSDAHLTRADSSHM